jgi:hypothetical protein
MEGAMKGKGRSGWARMDREGKNELCLLRLTIVTVPAQSFCAPVLAAVMAAARFMPGVCGVLVSRELPGMTRTPEFFQSSGGSELSDVACHR